MNEKSDCTKLYNFLNGNVKNYTNNCCTDTGIECDNEGYIISIKITKTIEADLNNFPYLSRIETLHINNGGLVEVANSIFS
ncbi:hypothetical protein U3516DRAFT_902593 [Neocallimastix sp. 'constans']